MMEGPLTSARNEKTRRQRSTTARRLQLEGRLGRACPSGIQISVFRFLCRMGVSGIRLEHREGRKTIDIAFLPDRLALEIDGAYWHENRSSKTRDQYLRRRGWGVKHFRVPNNCKKKKLFREVLNACI